jgi:hypothetical protein
MICTTSIGTVKNTSKENYPIEREACGIARKIIAWHDLGPSEGKKETADQRFVALHPQSPAAGY